MKLFMSYASEDRAFAEEIVLALRGADHEVFFDRSELPPSDDYHQPIDRAIEEVEGLVFLLSPDSVKPGRYTLTELKFAEEKWSHPKGHVLPVMVGETDYDLIPAYLRAVTILTPKGNAAAETVHAVARWDADSSTRRSLVENMELLAKQGKPDAQLALANAYATGAGVAPNVNKAVHWYMLAAASGSKNAGVQLGKLLWRLAEAGDVSVQYMLGSCYRTGEIWPSDQEQAKYWLERAAAQGHEEAAAELRSMIE